MHQCVSCGATNPERSFKFYLYHKRSYIVVWRRSGTVQSWKLVKLFLKFGKLAASKIGNVCCLHKISLIHGHYRSFNNHDCPRS